MRISAITLRLIILAACISSAAISGLSQDVKEPEGAKPAAIRQTQQGPELLRQLGLSREQIREVQRLNLTRKPLIESAQRRVGEASRSLDEAIYADQIDEGVVAERIKELQLAQAEIARIRSMSELAIRKLLTPEQLVRFRELRRRFAEARERFQERRQSVDRDGAARPMQNRQNRLRPRIDPSTPKPELF